jgi:uncharacterized protein YaiI (UPF0178 family)
LLNIYIDADACSVKTEIYKVAARYKLVVYVVANQYITVPMDVNIRMEVVSGGFDAADDWIVEKIETGDILITSDLLLADRAIKKQAKVLGAKGNELNEENIGEILASREIMSHLRDLGSKGTGPSAMAKTDRSQFLSNLDRVIQAVKKEYK